MVFCSLGQVFTVFWRHPVVNVCPGHTFTLQPPFRPITNGATIRFCSGRWAIDPLRALVLGAPTPPPAAAGRRGPAGRWRLRPRALQPPGLAAAALSFRHFAFTGAAERMQGAGAGAAARDGARSSIRPRRRAGGRQRAGGGANDRRADGGGGGAAAGVGGGRRHDEGDACHHGPSAHGVATAGNRFSKVFCVVTLYRN